MAIPGARTIRRTRLRHPKPAVGSVLRTPDKKVDDMFVVFTCPQARVNVGRESG